MNIAVLVPMKGHSERVPNKNLKMFNGKPLYHAIINTLIRSNYITEIYIDTDSDEIGNDVTKNFPQDFIHLIDRPAELCGDYISMNDIIKYDLSQIKDTEYFIQTHSTNPLLTTETIDKCIEVYLKSVTSLTSLFTVTKLQTRLYYNAITPINHKLGKELNRTQDLFPIFEENSNLYIFSKKSFKKAGDNRIGINPTMYEMNKKEAIDIDDQEDFELAEILYKRRKG